MTRYYLKLTKHLPLHPSLDDENNLIKCAFRMYVWAPCCIYLGLLVSIYNKHMYYLSSLPPSLLRFLPHEQHFSIRRRLLIFPNPPNDPAIRVQLKIATETLDLSNSHIAMEQVTDISSTIQNIRDLGIAYIGSFPFFNTQQ